MLWLIVGVYSTVTLSINLFDIPNFIAGYYPEGCSASENQQVDATPFIMYAGLCAIGYCHDPGQIQNWNCNLCSGLRNVQTVVNGSALAYIVDDPNEIILVFRGTQNYENWEDNVNFIPTPFMRSSNAKVAPLGLMVHSGFENVWKRLRNPVIEILQRMNVQNRVLTITGHSLGGALASLSALDLSYEFDLAPENLNLYIFSAPNPGSSTFSKYIQARVLSANSVMEFGDIVSFLPPIPLAFPVGQLFLDRQKDTLEKCTCEASCRNESHDNLELTNWATRHSSFLSTGKFFSACNPTV